MECEDVRNRLKAFVDDDLEGSELTAVRDHLDGCPSCSRAARQMSQLPGVLQAWPAAELPDGLYARLKAGLESREPWWRTFLTPAFAGRAALRIAGAAAVVLVTLAVSGHFRKPQLAPPDDEIATINFYVTEHQEAVVQAASVEAAERQPVRVTLDRDDIMYYEYIDEYRRISRPAVILRGPDSVREAGAAVPDPGIAGAETLTLPLARAAVGFEPVAPARVHPGYILDAITKVAGRESLHLLYTNGLDTFSVFEQPLGGDRGLAAEELRKYAVYRSSAADDPRNQGGMTILAWKNAHVSYVLIGRIDMSRMMEITQQFSPAGGDRNGSGE